MTFDPDWGHSQNIASEMFLYSHKFAKARCLLCLRAANLRLVYSTHLQRWHYTICCSIREKKLSLTPKRLSLTRKYIQLTQEKIISAYRMFITELCLKMYNTFINAKGLSLKWNNILLHHRAFITLKKTIHLFQ